MKNTALILIDIQNDYFPGGAFVLNEPENAAKNAAILLAKFRDQQRPIVHIQHENLNPDLPFMLPGTKGQHIHASVKPEPNETLIVKNYPSAFWQTHLEDHLKKENITDLIIVGMMTHMCVSTTVRAAMERGFNTTVISDACATLSLTLGDIEIPAKTVHQTALAELTLLATIVTLDELT